MLPITIAIIIGIFTAIKIADGLYGDWADWIFGILFGAFLGLLTLFIGALVLGLLLPKETVYINRTLVAIQDGSSTSGSAAGSVFMGYGSIKEVPSYTYYVKDGDARLLESTTAKGVKVFEGGEEAYVREATACKSDYNWISPCINFEKVVEIHVPTGTIKQNFVLDAK